MKMIGYWLMSLLIALCVGCSGADGEDGADGVDGADGSQGAAGQPGASGQDGQDGAAGEPGEDGAPGEPGEDAVDSGSIAGTVNDADGVALGGVTITTSPATETVTTNDEGQFSLLDVPVGAYHVNASLEGTGSASTVVGVAGGETTTVVITLGSDEIANLATISGQVVDAAGDAVEGAEVSIEGQTPVATSGADGTFTLSGVSPGPVFVKAAAPSEAYLDAELRSSLYIADGQNMTDVTIVLPGRPSAEATWVGGESCTSCHAGMHKDIVDGVDASIHARFVTEGTDHLVYPELWPEPGDKYLPRAPNGTLLMVQDPSDGEGTVNLAMCTRDDPEGRQYLFKFYPQQVDEISLTEEELDCSDTPEDAVWIPVGGTIGGEGNWGEGYLDPDHETSDTHPNFGEGKQRYLARIQDVPYLVQWMTDNGIPVDRAKQDYVAYMPVYVYQDATPAGSPFLTGENDVGGPKFWQKNPTHWCPPTNTISRNCAGCHTTGLKIEYTDVVEGEETHKAVVTAYDYIDLNVTCERCHGPGSEHASGGDVTKIINPGLLTARSSRETCGQCHTSHAGKSQTPAGIFKYAFDETHLDGLGGGVFVPGVYNLEDFFANYNLPTTKNDWSEGAFHTWPDGKHGRAHSQELPEMLRSAHAENPYQKLTCASCHNPHSLKGAPAEMTRDDVQFGTTSYKDNTTCLVCHAEHGPFADVSPGDVAALQYDAGRDVTVGGEEPVYDDITLANAHAAVAKAVAVHMQVGAGMGGALYTPTDDDSPVGRCTTCHMPKIGKLFDLNDDAQYHLALDDNGLSAVAEGNVASHTFDIVWPGQSSVLLSDDPSKEGHDYDIMPNSCGNCHSFARLSGDMD